MVASRKKTGLAGPFITCRDEEQLAEADQDELLEGAFAELETPEPKRSRSNVVALIALLVAFIGIIMAAYAAWNAWEMKTAHAAVETRLSRLDTDVSVAAGRPDLAPQLAKLERDLGGQLQQLESRAESRLVEVLEQLGSASATSSQDWLLAEAEFLIRMAHHRVQMEADAEGAVSLLKAADDVIRQGEIPGGFAVRAAIAADVAALELAPSVDITGYFLRISALSGQIDNLQEQQPDYAAPGVVPSDSVESAEASLGDRVLGIGARVGQHLSNQFEFRRGQEPIRPLLPASELYYLRQNLRLQLQTARLALLRRDQTVYAASLIESADWIETHFDDDQVSSVVVDALRELASANVEQSVPQIGASLAAVRKLMVNFEDSPAADVEVRR